MPTVFLFQQDKTSHTIAAWVRTEAWAADSCSHHLRMGAFLNPNSVFFLPPFMAHSETSIIQVTPSRFSFVVVVFFFLYISTPSAIFLTTFLKTGSVLFHKFAVK